MSQPRMPHWALSRTFLLSAAAWTLTMAVVLWYDVSSAQRHVTGYASAAARSVLAKDLSYRRWAAMHGGVYVPTTDETPANPYLADMVEEQNITTPSGRPLTLVNPAYMTRQVHELFDDLYGSKGHITSLNPIRPENVPDAWEREALQAFEEGVHEVATVAERDGAGYYRLMVPLVAEEGCLDCHEHQGYELGDVRGGLSTSVPIAPFQAAAAEDTRTGVATYATLWILGLLGLATTGRAKHRQLWEVQQSEARLTESERFLTEAQRIGRVGYYDFDIPAGTWKGSPLLERLLDVEPAPEHPVSAWLASIHPDDRDDMAAYLTELLASGERFDRGYRLTRRSDGETRWVWGRGEITRDGSGAALRMVGTIQDITDMEEADRALQEAEQRFRNLAENLPDMIYRYRILPEPGFEYMSPGATRIMGYTPDDYYADPYLPLAIVHPDDRPVLEAYLHGQIPDGPVVMRCRRKDGVTIWTEQRDSPVYDDDGRVVAIDGASRDISDRIRSDQERELLAAQLAQAQRLDSVGRLAGGVAHDFNNMMGIIIGHAELGLTKVKEKEPTTPEHLASILDAARRASDLTRKLLAFARQQAIQPAVLDLNEAVPEMVLLLQRLIGEHVELRWVPGAGVDQVLIDPTQLDQILTNLVVNARDAIQGHGVITLSTHNTVLDAAFCALHPEVKPGAYVELRVEDTGQGMDEATLAHIFEPFFTTKVQGAGSGLGLATVYGITQQNHGLVDVVSRKGRGSVFSVYLPRRGGSEDPAQGTSADHAGQEADADRPGSATILVVEDEAGILQLTAEILRRSGYTVLTASSPEAALRLVEEERPPLDLLLTDVVMPGMDGRALEARVLEVMGPVKVLFMSGYSEHVLTQRGVVPQEVTLMPKPFSRDQLLEAVRAVLTPTE